MEKLKEILSRVLNIESNKVNDKLARGSEEWDSFNHLLLISEIEKEMNIKFTTHEIEKIKTFKDLSEFVLSKKNK